MRLIIHIVAWISLGYPILGQESILPMKTDFYPFIQYEADRFVFCHDSSHFEEMFNRLDSILIYGEGQLSVVHFGGSHIQADMYTEKMRDYMQGLCADCNAGRGLVTPYPIAQTNNPSNYAVEYGGEWEYASIVRQKKDYNYGISGLTVMPKSDSAYIRINPNIKEPGKYLFNKVTIFHSAPYPISVEIVPDTIPYNITCDSIAGITSVTLENNLQEIEMGFKLENQADDSVFIYGLSLESQSPGIIYHTIGINGASLKSYLDARFLPRQLMALAPDLIIISVGTNDANTRNFDPRVYSERYRAFLDTILNVCPNTAILLTVPNDSWLSGKYINNNTEKVRREILQLGCDYKTGVWDLYTIMGGLNSISDWYAFDMARPDHIHFSKKGYELKGDLLFNAFLRAFNDHIHYIETRNINLNN